MAVFPVSSVMAVSVPMATATPASVPSVAMTAPIFLERIVELLFLICNGAFEAFRSAGFPLIHSRDPCHSPITNTPGRRHVLARCNLFQSVVNFTSSPQLIHVWIVSLGHWQTKSAGECIFLGLFDSLDLLFTFSCSFGGSIFVTLGITVCFSIPGEITAFLPTTNGGHQ
ncbi:hypothetical protein FOPE_12568 [Fonsecaea pedrosoi]|nr:hypothetical protein FOPE_12568 [Fonsecaea pedrosoi]